MTTNSTISQAQAPAASSDAQVRSRGRAIAREAALVAAGTAAIALIGQISLPLPFTPVPVTLGTFAVLGVGGLLGSRRAVLSALLFAVLAAAGAPVLAGWGSGVTATFGYVIGYLPAAWLAGRATARPLVARQGEKQWQLLGRRLGLMLLASALVYVPGVAWLKVATGAAWQAALAMGMLPFLVGDLLKSTVAALLPSRH